MYKKLSDGSFEVTSRSKGMSAWVVSPNMKSCSCPKFKFILKGQGNCHHMIEVIQGEHQVTDAINKSSEGAGQKTFDDNKYPTPLTLYDFIEEYGEDQYRNLVAEGEIMLISRRVRVLK